MQTRASITVRPLRGPNLWAPCPVLEVTLTGAPDPAGLAARTIGLQIACGAKVAFHAAAGQRIAVEFEDEELARRCLDAALHPPGDIAALREFGDQVLLGPNTRALYDAARRRSIPIRRLNLGSLLQLGHGIHQRRLCGAETDRTSSIAESLSCNKPLVKQLLHAVGVPTPEGHIVTTAAEACRAAAGLDGSVVVKPENGNHGRAVFIGLTEPAEIAAAFEAALLEADGGSVLVERCIHGAEHRVLVVNGRVAGATRGEALYVTGDGVRALPALLDELNQDPRRGDEADRPLSLLEFDDVTIAVLARQGYQPGSVPPAGERVLIQRNGNLSVDVTAQVHPENAELLALAARTVGLDIAGIDLVAEDIAVPFRGQGGAIIEVNAMPAIVMHLQPGTGQPQPVHELIVESVFPPGATGRIPIVAVQAGPGSTSIAREIAGLLQNQGIATGLTCADGTFILGRQTRHGNCATSQAASDLLLHPLVQAAVFETPDAAILDEGLAFEYCDVAVITGPHTPATRILLATLAPTGAVTQTAAEAVRSLPLYSDLSA